MILSDKDKSKLLGMHNRFKSNSDLQKAISDYSERQGLILPEDIRFSPGIDYVDVRFQDHSVLIVCLPPVSNYNIHETEYTDEYLRPQKVEAV